LGRCAAIVRFAKLLAVLPLLVARDAPAAVNREPRACDESTLGRSAPAPRVAAWARTLSPIDVTNVVTGAGGPVRLYALDGTIDESERRVFERLASSCETSPRPLSPRLEQLVVKAAYHFDGARVLVVSGWRAHAGRHGTGDALDFKLEGVHAARLAAYLRTLPRVGVGIYTHPRTQYVHLDVRDASYHWLDASPPGVRWREMPLRNAQGAKVDAAWTPEMDLP